MSKDSNVFLIKGNQVCCNSIYLVKKKWDTEMSYILFVKKKKKN